ncbi:MAG: hypothetical protein F6K48_13000 [Okeania sp. SIO3H1]|uniref:hypothetical protein n=1 Tax=Okeania sp. SIO1I7 TaxID=2607772 RepID=UPI0013C6E707|nr:hypothetical protein [Okeania sp. SIO1I7]NEN89773.1 hypothetical protein [Okeania sp. SIO3H1]NET30007.1 hypothetical protein [Okeania sp. SIO1I7]
MNRVQSYKNVDMDKKVNGTQGKSRGTRGNQDEQGVQLDSNKHSSAKGGSREGECKSLGDGGEVNPGEFSVESIQQTFFKFTGKILRGLLNKSHNDKRVWEDRLQEARDCIEWYQDLLEKCEKEISIADAQISEVEGMLTQLKQE